MRQYDIEVPAAKRGDLGRARRDGSRSASAGPELPNPSRQTPRSPRPLA